MVPDNASSSCANFAMSGHMTGQSADNCALNASLRFRSRRKYDSEQGDTDKE